MRKVRQRNGDEPQGFVHGCHVLVRTAGVNDYTFNIVQQLGGQRPRTLLCCIMPPSPRLPGRADPWVASAPYRHRTLNLLHPRTHPTHTAAKPAAGWANRSAGRAELEDSPLWRARRRAGASPHVFGRRPSRVPLDCASRGALGSPDGRRRFRKEMRGFRRVRVLC